MKKILFSVAVLAAFASCSKNAEVSMPQGDAIGFATLNNRVTKVANTNEDATNSDYQVYAKSSEVSAWLIDEVVSSSDQIKSGNTYYWPQSPATVDFYAYAPATGVTEGTIEVGTSIPLTFTVPADADTDFTVATPLIGATSSTMGVVDGKATLKFSHMLSKASFEVKLEENLANNHDFTFSAVKFTVAKNAVTADAAAEVADGAKPAGTTSGTTATYDYNFASLDLAKSFVAYNSLFFAPKTAGSETESGYDITLEDVVVKSGETQIFSGDLVYKIADTQAFEQGKAYNFVITITTTATGMIEITFASTEDTWVPSTGGTDVELS